MPLDADSAVEAAKRLQQWHFAERSMLDEVFLYWRGRQRLPGTIPRGAPFEVREMARVARVNICSLVVDTFAQSLFVDGYRGRRDEDNADVWRAWQANRFDKHQTGLHRSMEAYGTAYTVVLPNGDMPEIRALSPRRLTAVYGQDQDWPQMALEKAGDRSWLLYDEEQIYFLASDDERSTELELIDSTPHGVVVGGEPVVPVVRYVSEVDLDSDDAPDGGLFSHGETVLGQVAPMMRLQDQIDMTTFSLLVAQHYGAFRQRYVLGWVADSEAEALKASAARVWQFEDHPDDIELGEFSQTQVDGYIKSRESSLKHAAALAQAPAHELIGEMVNLSAEALAAAEAGRDRKVDEQQIVAGESHEQTLQVAAALMGVEVPEDAQVVWRDTRSRSLSQTVDALGKMVSNLGVPPEEIWERIPNTSQQDVERWKAAAAQDDSLDRLTEMLQRQNGSANGLVENVG